MDNLTPKQRRKNMQHIHSKDTRIEVVLRKALWAKGYRYRKNWSELPGKPDIVLIKYKIAIFCDSEFFHGKDWEVLKPRLEKGNNPDYWIPKITRNMERDMETDKKLLFLGWTVLHFWGERYIEASGRVYTGCRRNNFGTKNRARYLKIYSCSRLDIINNKILILRNADVLIQNVGIFW